MVRAKFRCFKKESNGDGFNIQLEPVAKTDNPDDENSKFFRYTPGGLVSLHCLNPAASQQFELDKEYYIDFTPAEAKEVEKPEIAKAEGDENEWDH